MNNQLSISGLGNKIELFHLLPVCSGSMRKITRHNRTLVFLPTWRLVVVFGMYCAPLTQIGAWVIFTIEQKPIHPAGDLLLIIGAIVTALLGHMFGRKDLQRIRNLGGQLEVTRAQGLVVAVCCGMVPGILLLLVILSGI